MIKQKVDTNNWRATCPECGSDDLATVEQVTNFLISEAIRC